MSESAREGKRKRERWREGGKSMGSTIVIRHSRVGKWKHGGKPKVSARDHPARDDRCARDLGWHEQCKQHTCWQHTHRTAANTQNGSIQT